MEFHERIRAVQKLTPDCTYRVDYGLSSIPRFIEQYGVDLNPDYQRHYVWSELQKQKFVGSVIQNHNSIPIFWFNTISLKRSEVVDGKQRISAILGWLNDEYPAICPCGETFWWRDCDKIGERNFSMYTTLKMYFVKLSRVDVLKFYLSLNSGGTIHSEDDLNKVREMLSNNI